MLRDSIARFFKVDSLISNLTGYVETRIELLKVEAKEELSKGLSNVIVFLLLAFVFALVVVFISVSVAFLIGVWVGVIGGFAIVAAIYLLAGIILVVKREPLTKTLEKKIASMFKKKKDNYGTARNG
jgi:uncharacterized membrane protein YqjE